MSPVSDADLIDLFAAARADIDSVPFDRPAADTDTAMAVNDVQSKSDVGLLTCFVGLVGFLLLVTFVDQVGKWLGWW